jgi:predicted dehydrogenase
MDNRPEIVRVALAGCGKAAWTGHLPAIARSQRLRLAAVMDLEPTRLNEVGARWPEARRFQSPDELFAADDIDALVIATPPSSHLELACRAAERGWGVYIEKPMVRDAAEADALAEVLNRHDTVAAVGHQMRFHPTYQRLAQLLRGGTIGQPYYVGVHWATNAKLDPDLLIPKGYDNYFWRWRDPTVGGGIVQDHLPHIVDLVRYWTDAEPESVYAVTMNVARDLLGWAPDRSVWEDFGAVMVRFAGGLLLRLETGTVGRSLSPIWSLGSGVGEWTQYGYILGTEGQLVFDLLMWDSTENGRLAVWTLEGARSGLGWTYIEQPEPDRMSGSPGGAGGAMFLQQLESFADLVGGKPSRIATLNDGIVSVRIVDAAYASARSNQVSRLSAIEGSGSE